MAFDNATVARRYFNELWAKGNLDLANDLCDPGIILKDPMTPGGLQGIDALKERIKGMQNDFSDNMMQIEEIIVAEDRVIVRSTWTGAQKGDFLGFKNTGKRLTCTACDVLKIRNGKVVEDVSYFDTYEMAQQLGAPPLDQLRDALKQQPSATKQPTMPT